MSYALETKKRKFHRVLESLTKPSNTESSNQTADPATALEHASSAKRARLSGGDSILASVRKDILRKDILKKARSASRSSSVSSQSRPSFVPWDRERFLERLETFRRVDRWSPKPTEVNEVEWAKRGWICTDVARVTCVSACGGSVIVKIPDELDELDGYDGDKIQERKEVPTIHRLPLTNPDTAISSLRTRYLHLLEMANQLPNSHALQTPEGFNAKDMISILPEGALQESGGLRESTETQQPVGENSQETASQPSGQDDPPINEVALSLAFLGWDSVEGSANLAGCGACFRRLGLWMYKPKRNDNDPDMDPLDAANEHMEYCPWINSRTQSSTGNPSEKTEGLHNGWELLTQALKVRHQRQTRMNTPISSRAGSEAPSADDPFIDEPNDDAKRAKDRECREGSRPVDASVEKLGARGSPDAAAHDQNGSPSDKKRKLQEEEDKSQSAADRSGPKRKRVQERHQKRRAGPAPPSAYSRRDAAENARAPPRNERRSPSPPLPPRRSPTPEAQARQRKRPGGGARRGLVDPETIRRRQEERDRAQQDDAMRYSQSRGVTDIVRQHYNAVPQRGREWRKTDSKIKGLRTFNNWVKSTLIQKFSPDEEFVSRVVDTKDWANDAAPPPMEEKRLLVIDLGCGKGGDLGKWQLAPQPIDLYVGLDPADVSIDQARDRYAQLRTGRGPRQRRGPLFHAEFAIKDCFGEWLGDVPIVQEVGIDANVGPGGNIMSSRWGAGGFDVVASMFTIHYAFESEGKTRQMLRNVAGCLKKGGRFLGVCPNSDVISSEVAKFHTKRKEGEAAKKEDVEPEDGEVEDDEKMAEWGNSIYRVRFPGATPEDGVFRPPFGWKYSYFMEEAVEEIPEYVVPWEAFRALTEEYNLELQYRKPFLDVWRDEKNDSELGPLSERMGVRDRATGDLLMTEAEKEAASPSRGQPSSSSRQRDRDPSRGAIGTATPRRAGTPPLPAYELPVAPLTEAGRQALQSLLRSQSLRLLKTHIRHAEAKITESAGEVNDRLADAKIKAQRRKERKDRERDASRSMTEAGDEEGNVDADDGVNEDVVRVRELGQSVEDVTRRLDETMRRAIDSGVRVDGLVDILGRLQEEVEASAGAARQQQRLRRRRRRGENDEDEEDGLYEATPEPEVDGEEISLRRKLEQRMAEDQAKWDDLTLTERYSKHNDYISFKRMVHDAKHPGEDTPPVPNPNTWFAHLEDPNASRKRRSSSSAAAPSRNTRHQVAHESTQDSDDGNDIAIERERISLKCPLTLLPFHDPVTSTKCPHSFERSAITDMIDRSAQTVPAAASSSGRGGRRIRAVKCPVCEVVLTNNDLREDPVLLRRVRRAEAARRRDEEDDEDGMSVSGRRKSGRGGIELGSDDEDGNGEEPMDVDPVRIKVERARSRGVSEFGDRSQDVRTESDTQDSNEDEREDDDEDDAE
ncbi:mRNA capping enzyme-domain-containing protein [Aspergillus undulatus]|uniref:mRNA capping enzyme-domain-containing protein n=1 Tax=Aspergillus undulatus TaxID=1810928 RepID=UPI003CCCD8B1